MAALSSPPFPFAETRLSLLSMSMIALENVSVSANGRDILKDITLELDEHRVAVIGSNGSGKSTFARLLNALVLPGSGEVRIAGISTRKDARKARAVAGLVFQNPEHQIVMPSVEEDLAFGLKNLGFSKPVIKEKATAILEAYGMTHLREQPAHLLSGGEKKLLSILSVLVMEPQVVVFDEPLASLDLVNRRRVEDVIDSLPQRVITIAHDLDTIGHYDRAILLSDGRLAADGAPRDVIACYLEMMNECSPSISRVRRRSTAVQPA